MALETHDKRQRQRHTLATVYACTVPGGRFPAKFGCQPIKLELYLPVHTYTANNVGKYGGGEPGGLGSMGRWGLGLG